MPDNDREMPVGGSNESAPIVERPELPAMEVGEGREEQSEVNMLSFTDAARGSDGAEHPDRPEVKETGHMGEGPQQPGPARRADGDPDESYVRLKLHVENGETSLRGASRVEGPLTTAEHPGGAFAYEVTLDGQRLAGDALGDLGTWRSFPSPDPQVPEQRGHHLTKARAYDFTVRIPVSKLPADGLERVEVALLRVTDSSRPLVATQRALTDQYPVEVRAVSRLRGTSLAEGLRQALAAPAAPAMLPQA